MAKKFTWKVWLRLNLLTKEVENDYVAEVSTRRMPRDPARDRQLAWLVGALRPQEARTIIYNQPLTVS
jgi:hypothetical protein